MKIFIFFQKPKPVFIIRPLLCLDRNTLKKWILFLDLPLCIDFTNRQVFFKRNRIRFFLFPFLRYFFDFQIQNQISKSAQITNDQVFYFGLICRQLFFFIYYQQNIYWLLPSVIQKQFLKNFLKYSKKSFSYKEIYYINNNLFKNSNVNFIRNFYNQRS